MSYSRWSHSRWYSFWSVPVGDAAENRDIARFEVMDAIDPLNEGRDYWFSAAEIREDIDACLKRIKDAEPSDLAELKGYMLEFVQDVDRAYQEAS